MLCVNARELCSLIRFAMKLRMKDSRCSLTTLLFSAFAIILPQLSQASSLHLEQIQLPPGFKISLYNDQVPGARSMALSPTGVLYVGTREDGNLYALKAGKVHKIAQGLNMPNGVAWKDGSLYVAEVNQVTRYDGIDDKLDQPPRPVIVNATFPTDKGHGWKFIRFSPDGKWLYVPVGGPCNSCIQKDPRYASILRMHPDGSGLEVFASGVRNSVGFDWDPATGDLWFTDNGRDNLGDDLPPDELNHAPKKGMNFGFPYCHGGTIPDPDFGRLKGCGEFTPPAQALGAHVASLGMRFYTGQQFPPEYRGQIFIAEHGSWNRTKKSGYRISLVRLKAGKAVSYEPFATGWLQGEENWGRPVDLQQLPDGDLLVSDDLAGAIYRISYSKP
jgi:glucose/arabinose dehydrogenase